jgi:hypothetical protein|tara:strand:- start:80 stop:376 length:297 start_codon:yes stop_codon:yes gene_type:complete
MAMMPMGGPPMPMPPNGGGMPGGPMPGGPMPPGPQGGPPPEWLMQQMLAEQGPAPPAGGDMVGALQGLLDSWTERDPSTIAGQYYQDLASVVAAFTGG